MHSGTIGLGLQNKEHTENYLWFIPIKGDQANFFCLCLLVHIDVLQLAFQSK